MGGLNMCVNASLELVLIGGARSPPLIDSRPIVAAAHGNNSRGAARASCCYEFERFAVRATRPVDRVDAEVGRGWWMARRVRPLEHAWRILLRISHLPVSRSHLSGPVAHARPAACSPRRTLPQLLVKLTLKNVEPYRLRIDMRASIHKPRELEVGMGGLRHCRHSRVMTSIASIASRHN